MRTGNVYTQTRSDRRADAYTYKHRLDYTCVYEEKKKSVCVRAGVCVCVCVKGHKLHILQAHSQSLPSAYVIFSGPFRLRAVLVRVQG